MARSGLDKNRKFLRLSQQLNHLAAGMGDALALGLLEHLWAAAYERADDYLGDADDVESAAHWRGERGVLTAALLGAGGTGEAGFIELDRERGGYKIHDLWEHAPPWVKRKARAALQRKADGKTISDIRREAGKASQFSATRQTVDQLPDHTPASGRPVDGKKTLGRGTGEGGGEGQAKEINHARASDPSSTTTTTPPDRTLAEFEKRWWACVRSGPGAAAGMRAFLAAVRAANENGYPDLTPEAAMKLYRQVLDGWSRHKGVEAGGTAHHAARDEIFSKILNRARGVVPSVQTPRGTATGPPPSQPTLEATEKWHAAQEEVRKRVAAEAAAGVLPVGKHRVDATLAPLAAAKRLP